MENILVSNTETTAIVVTGLLGPTGDITPSLQQLLVDATAAKASATASAGTASTAAGTATAAAGTAATAAGTATSKAAEAVTSAETASTAASTAATSAGTTATKAAEAAASATTAATAAGTATAAATAADSSAASAAVSAGTATTKAAEAGASAALAGSSKDTVAGLLATFRRVLLGSFASDALAESFASTNLIPITDGIMYENTVVDKFRIYTGTAWQDYDSSAQVSQSAAALSAADAGASAGSALASANNAQDAAQIATVQASTATTQAGVATTQAGVATVKAAQATQGAQDAGVQAQQAAESAAISTMQATAAGAFANTTALQSGIATTKAIEASTSAAAAQVSAAAALASQTASAGSAAAANTSAGNASGSAASALAIYGTTAAQQAALTNAQSAASLAQGYALSASSAVQQDLSGATAQALHRSPNAVTAMFVYDTSKDSDGGAWTEKCQHTSWYNEALNGKWLGAQPSEIAARATGATLGPERITNAGFDNGLTGWTAITQFGAVVATGGTVSFGPNIANNWSYISSQAIATTVGQLCRFVIDAKSISRQAALKIGSTASGTQYFNVILAPGQNVFYFTPTTTTTYIDIMCGASVGDTLVIESVSLKDVTTLTTASGDYYQSTVDGKFYKLNKNLLKYSQDLSQAWDRSGCVVNYNVTAAPDGTNTADLIVSASSVFPIQSISNLLPIQQTLSVYAKQETGSTFALRVSGIVNNQDQLCTFNLATQTATWPSTNQQAGAVAAIVSVGNGWYRCSITYVGTTTSGYIATSSAVGIYVWGAQLEYGSNATAYEVKTADGTVGETFRGNKADFPRLVGIVAEAASVTIYDLTEAGRPMWMRQFSAGGNQTYWGGFFSTTGVSTLSALNGVLCVGGYNTSNSGYGRLTIVNFPIDNQLSLTEYATTQTIEGINKRNQPFYLNASRDLRIKSNVNAVAMTVLPDAPVDAVTGLQVPTIAVATAGGVSVIKHDGTVKNVNIAANTNTDIAFNGKTLYVSGVPSTNLGVFSTTDINGATISINNYFASFGLPQFDMTAYNDGSQFEYSAANKILATRPNNNGIRYLRENASTGTRSLAARIDNKFNTGWKVGDIRRAYLADVDVGSVSGTELVTSTTQWAATPSTTVNSANSLTYANESSGNWRFSFFSGLVVGKTYRVAFTSNKTADGGGGWSVFANGSNLGSIATSGANSFSFVYATNFYFFVHAFTTGTLTDISITEVVADRSYKAKFAPITGTLTKTQVAAASQLVAYSGFSAANYLREPYSADLDFGTGEWSASAWVNYRDLNYSNRLLNPENLGAAPWTTVAGSLSQDGTLAPTGVQAWKYTVDASGNSTLHQFRTTNINDVSIAYDYQVLSVYIKPNGLNKVRFGFAPDNRDDYAMANIDFSTKTIVRNGTGVRLVNTTLEELENGWFRAYIFIDYTPGSNGGYIGVYGLDSSGSSQFIGDGSSGFYLTGFQLSQNCRIKNVYTPGKTSSYFPPYAIADRSFSSGASIKLQANGTGLLTATAFDGTTTRTVTTTAAYNTATWIKPEAVYTTDGTLAIRVNGVEVAATRGTPLLSLNSKYNQITYSEDLTNAVWVALGGAQKVNATTFNPTAQYSYVVAGLAGKTPGTTFTFSAKVAAVSGNTALTMIAEGVTNVFVPITVTSTPQRFSVTGVVNSSGFLSMGVQDRNTSGFGTVYMSEMQVDIGSVALPYQRVGAATDFNFQAPLTIGNSFAADAPFPGSIALLKFSATVPTSEQSQWMYEQEKQMFREGAQVTLPDAGSIVDLAYDDATDKWLAVSATNESEWSGLVRTSVTASPAGSYSKISAASGIQLQARTTTNPGVDVTIPPYGLREELVNRSQAAARLARSLVSFDYVGGFTANTTTGSTAITSAAGITYPVSYVGTRVSGTGIPADTFVAAVSGTTVYLTKAATATATAVQIRFNDFVLPVGYEAKTVLLDGVAQREGGVQAYTRLFDGFKETIRFTTAPSNTAFVQIQATRSTQ